MTKKIKEKIENINKISKNIIKYGTLFSCLLIAIGVILLYKTPHEFIAQELIKSAVTVWAEIIIGGLFIDFVF
ncbi:MAG: hypothetical protein IJS47_07050 [Clostridia bacterium]|nr:hypothetical protein [Clostridia bacterium]